MSDAADLEALLRAVRAAFNRLRALGDALHGDLGITASMRAVMEHLAEAGPMSVPCIARAKGVTRQHIQTIADALAAAGLVTLGENPAHKRSPLVALSRAGARAFAEMQRRERRVLGALGRTLEGHDLAHAHATLAALVAALDDLSTTSTKEPSDD